MNPLGIFITLALSLPVLTVSRQTAAAMIIAGVCYLTQGQQINIGFHFTAIRIILLIGLLRVASNGELGYLRMNAIDRAMWAYALGIFLIPTMRTGTSTEFVYQLGVMYNILVAYFVFRALIRDFQDLQLVLAKTALVIVPFALVIAFECKTNHNIFAILGGVSDATEIRNGSVRCEGSFRSPITAGAFGATFSILYASMLFARAPERSKIIIGLAASITILICSHSSGPLIGAIVGLLSLGVWRIRHSTSLIRRGIVVSIVILHLIMKAPVWFLIARVSDVFGGGGYHRAELIDQFIKHFSSWWLIGMDVSATASWFPYELVFGQADLTNQFVSDGVNAGLIGIFLSISILVCCFRGIGKIMLAFRTIDPNAVRMTWGLGSTLVCTIAIFFSITYFDQMGVIWALLLAAIASVASVEAVEEVTLSDSAENGQRVCETSSPSSEWRRESTEQMYQ